MGRDIIEKETFKPYQLSGTYWSKYQLQKISKLFTLPPTVFTRIPSIPISNEEQE